VKPLDRKLLRDLRRLAPQVVAIAMLGAIGVAVAVMANSGLKALSTAQALFYGQTRFADVFAGAERAPSSLTPRLRAVDGVVAVDARASGAGLMAVPGLSRPASVRLIALPADPASALNTLVLNRGRMPAADRRDEAVALTGFLDAAHVSLGDRLTATINGRRTVLTIVGAALSPEYVYAPSAESALPDDAHSAVLWAPRTVVEDAAGQVGAFSQVSLKLARGARLPQVLLDVDRILAPYGGTPALARVDQPSNHYLVEGFKRLRTLSLILPPIFLIVAAALTHMVVSRLVETEREQIGLLKAFGYGDVETALPYVKLAAVIGLLGALLGGLFGASLAAALTRLYADYFRFPVLTTQFSWLVFVVSASAAMAAGIGGSMLAVSRVVALRPAAAMQAAPPAAYRRGVLDRLGLVRPLDQPTRMILRRIERFPAKAALTAAGLAASLALLVGTQFLYGAIGDVIDQTYYRTQRWNEQLSFFHPRQVSAIAEARRLPGVIAAEPVRVTVAWAQGPAARKRVPILGLEADARLAGPLDGAGRRLPFEGRGVILSDALAGQLGVAAGGAVELQILEGRRPRVLLPVTALARDFSGLFVYMARGELNRILGDGDLASGADLLAAVDHPEAFYAALEQHPQIIAAASRDDTVASWRADTAKSFSVSIAFYLGFAGAIAFGVAYSMGRITLAERERDLATLQVLGFSKSECAYILFGEIAVIALAAAPVGVAAGVGLAHGLAAAFARDELRFPIEITTRTLGVSLIAYVVAVTLAALMLVRRLWSLDLVGVLKTRE
jgi:putative ABC transport system permease protein